MDKFIITYLKDGVRHESSVVANYRDEAICQFLAANSDLTKDRLVSVAELGHAVRAHQAYRPKSDPSKAAIMSDLGGIYAAGITLSTLISFIGCIVAISGAVAMEMAILREVMPAIRAIIIYSGATSLFPGLVLLVAGQVYRVTVDTAENARRILMAIERQV